MAVKTLHATLKHRLRRHLIGPAGSLMMFLLLLPAVLSGAESGTAGDTIAVFSFRHSSIQYNALSQKMAQDVMDTFNRLGRFMPVEAERVQKAMEAIPEGAGEDALRAAAEKLGADLYAVVTILPVGNYTVGTIIINPVSDRFKTMKHATTVRSMVLMNVSLKIMREIALLHRDLPVQADVIEKRDGRFLIGAGQWQGLAPGRYRTDRGEPVIIHNCGRFRSLATLPDKSAPGARIAIRSSPPVKGLLREINDRIDYNTNYKYGISSSGAQRPISSAPSPCWRPHGRAGRPSPGNVKPLFLHVSTDEVYGSLGATGFFTETTPYDPRSPYSASKASSDHLVCAYFHTYGLPILITNCSNNYGPYQFPEKLIPLIFHNCMNGTELPVYGDGKNIRDWLYVNDHCEAILQVLDKGRDGRSYNIGGNNEKPNIEVVTLICDILDNKIGLLPSGEPRRSLIRFVKDRLGHDRRYAIDATRTKEEIGWQPRVTFEQGIEQTIDWYLANRDWVKDVVDGSYQKYYEKMYGNRH